MNNSYTNEDLDLIEKFVESCSNDISRVKSRLQFHRDSLKEKELSSLYLDKYIKVVDYKNSDRIFYGIVNGLEVRDNFIQIRSKYFIEEKSNEFIIIENRKEPISKTMNINDFIICISGEEFEEILINKIGHGY